MFLLGNLASQQPEAPNTIMPIDTIHEIVVEGNVRIQPIFGLHNWQERLARIKTVWHKYQGCSFFLPPKENATINLDALEFRLKDTLEDLLG